MMFFLSPLNLSSILPYPLRQSFSEASEGRRFLFTFLYSSQVFMLRYFSPSVNHSLFLSHETSYEYCAIPYP